ncbi:MAG: glycolate oxidase subunit GlcE [Gammaproteobacteria bacterium]|nr:glycolate oxidase subunit GlcE [Gammaproteobacteria bacterium]
MTPSIVPDAQTQDVSEVLIDAVRDAFKQRTPLVIHGGKSKAFYGRAVEGEPLDVSPHRGVVNYEPTELVLSARAGTRLTEIETLLVEQGQMLPFEPPHFGERATISGCVAAGLSGPRRPYAGAVRDNLLGVVIVNGQGQRLKFGGEVMKNVAGYDLSRLMAGALGTLGVLLQVSFKVLPTPKRETTLLRTLDSERAIKIINDWARRPLPISATWHDGDCLYTRLAGGHSAIDAAVRQLDGEPLDDGDAFWRGIREQTAPFFAGETPLWRLSVPPAMPMLDLPGDWAIEWNGALRWLKTDVPAKDIRTRTTAAGGHATLFRGGDRASQVFQPLSSVLMAAHKRLKAALDPAGILNSGRMYHGL